MPKSYSQILPKLYLGGTKPENDFSSGPAAKPSKYPSIDVVFSFHENSSAVTGNTLEVRYPFDDDWKIGLKPENISRINDVAKMAHSAWKDGHRVLLRCQGGKNRSALVMGVVLLIEGYEPARAIELMRDKRDPEVLFNEHFVRALHEWML